MGGIRLWAFRCLVVFLWLLPLPAYGQNFEVVFFNVGQGDSLLLISPTGETLLFDSGKNGQGSATVLPFLNSRGIDQLDYFVASHYHADHIGGIDEVLAGGVSLGISYDRGGTYTTQTYQDYVAAVGAARTTMDVEDVIDLGGGVTATCVAVNGEIIGGGQVPVSGTSQEENARSIVLLISFDCFEMLVGGDLTGGGFSTADVETSLAAQLDRVEVYKTHHHGSDTSSNTALLAALLPQIAVIPVGDGNGFGHPHAEVIDRLTALGTVQAIYQMEAGEGGTSPKVWVANGNIFLTSSDGSEFTVEGDSLPSITYGQGVDLVINEIMKDPFQVSDELGEYFEVLNNGDLTVDLHDMVIADDDFDMHTINAPGGLQLSPGELLVLGLNDNPLQNGGLQVDYVYNNFFLGNGTDEVVLGWNVEGTLVAADRVVYNDAQFPDTPGRSMELVDSDADNSQPQFWAETLIPYGDGDLGTPGSPNSTAVTCFIRGDSNQDGNVDIGDPVLTLNFLFSSETRPSCGDALDANDDGSINIGDAVYTLNYLFSEGNPPLP
ncbi:MAG: MBL fold metallo-hydrolase, partial [Planctomycetota bacterium]